ncbi:hypothetical protein E1176_19255 [Fulvivirga sp. RKSG066]|uniref:hypothetical protein n=1 Tax=Fulvivirga aurantia TaxID=2529383 RepID=UPI0012BD11C9|nr:hypothetical protein [Fulvivirga aurantia]MTI23176.1 hypothetical protein [Fulvivirga aurantia]
MKKPHSKFSIKQAALTVLSWPLLLMLLFIGTTSCDVEEIPEVDDIPPTFTFSISGPGGAYSFNQDDDFENLQLNILAGATYRFAFIGSDEGGVSIHEFSIAPYDNFNLSDLVPSTANDEVIGLSRSIRQLGDRSDPKTSLTLSGQIEVLPLGSNESLSTEIGLYVRDFGGASRDYNSTSARLQILLVNEGSPLGLINLP